ncbi:unnamed protein product [Rotaria sp. Silwood1]|nr:unnamed protein product [Rotaria sp. Silwood1]
MSLSFPPQSPFTLPKIRRIVKPEQEQAAKSTKITLLSTSLSQVHVLHQDLGKALKYSRLLEYTEAARQNGNYEPIEGKSQIVD